MQGKGTTTGPTPRGARKGGYHGVGGRWGEVAALSIFHVEMLALPMGRRRLKPGLFANWVCASFLFTTDITMIIHTVFWTGQPVRTTTGKQSGSHSAAC